MKTARHLLIAFLLLIFVTNIKSALASPDGRDSGDTMLAAKVAAKGDPVLDALLTEMERSKADSVKLWHEIA